MIKLIAPIREAYSTLFISIILCFTFPLNSLEYGFFLKSENAHPITKLFVISERCSGSNFINSLILQNFEIKEEHLGHKHFPPWYDLPLEHYSADPRYYTFSDTEEFLFVVIFRNPYDWIRSLFRTPWHADPTLCNIPFSQFIRTIWKLDSNDDTILKRHLYPLLDLNPIDKLPFKNSFELRTAKIKNMLQIKDRAPNVYFINYEIVCRYPQEVLEELNNNFKLVKKTTYDAVTYIKGDPRLGEYKPRKYNQLSLEDLDYINSQLNEQIENEIGYKLIYNPHELDEDVLIHRIVEALLIRFPILKK
jgi:hypothetical protein